MVIAAGDSAAEISMAGTLGAALAGHPGPKTTP
jgi:hypothetical protein